MSKNGITLAFGVLAAFGVPASYPPYQPKTYNRRGGYDGITNLALLPATHAGLGAPAAGGCVGVSQTFTANGTFTSSCTGTLTMETWAGGASAAYVAGAGAGSFAESPIVVTNGQKFLAVVGAVATGGSSGHNSFICPTAVAACTTALTICSGTSLTSYNFVCANHGTSSTNSAPGAGGDTASSVGVTLFKGGDGGTAIASPHSGGGGGGAGGPDGAGVVGGNSTAVLSGAGGTGDNGSGGAGGAAVSSGVGNAGTANVLGGGGGSGGFFGTGGNGGAPGGASGGDYGAFPTGARGQIIVHSMLDPAIEDAIRSPGNVGTVSMS